MTGTEIKKLRMRLGFTQDELGRAIGVRETEPRKAVSRWENGGAVPRWVGFAIEKIYSDIYDPPMKQNGSRPE